jgi:TMEM175 potassium channel family protein
VFGRGNRQALVRVFGVDVAGPQPTETRTEREFDYDRTVALSDGVFAIAMTLLILNVANPENGSFADKFSDVLPAVSAYALSFAVIGMLWIRHHALYRDLQKLNGRLVRMNLLYLGLIAFLPFPTGLLSDQGDTSFSVAMYAATLALTAGVASWTRVYVKRHGMLKPDSISAEESAARTLIITGVFALSVPIALISPSAGEWTWLLLVVFAVRERVFRS